MGDFKRLIAWQKAHAYVISVHTAFKAGARRLRQACAPKFCAR